MMDTAMWQLIATGLIFTSLAVAFVSLVPSMRARVHARIEDHARSEDDDEPLMVRLARRAAPLAERSVPGRLLDGMQAAHLPAGAPWPTSRPVLGGLCIVWALASALTVFAMALALDSAELYAATLVCLPLGALLPLLDLQARAREREDAVMRAMPWMLDLVVLALRSGAALEAALAAYADVCRDDVLPDEVGRMVRSLRLGETRDQVLERLCARCPFEPVEEVVRSLQSLNRIGRSITGVLETLAADLRATAVQREEAAAAAAGEKMLVPLLLMGVAFMVVILAPFVSNLSQVM